MYSARLSVCVSIRLVKIIESSFVEIFQIREICKITKKAYFFTPSHGLCARQVVCLCVFLSITVIKPIQ